jgi:hypothetical protein
MSFQKKEAKSEGFFLRPGLPWMGRGLKKV